MDSNDNTFSKSEENGTNSSSSFKWVWISGVGKEIAFSDEESALIEQGFNNLLKGKTTNTKIGITDTKCINFLTQQIECKQDLSMNGRRVLRGDSCKVLCVIYVILVAPPEMYVPYVLERDSAILDIDNKNYEPTSPKVKKHDDKTLQVVF
jgi:hypothetical protein